MRIATWNVNSLRVRLPQVLDWLARTPVDVLALQETKLTDGDLPHAELAGLGYQVLASGQKTYNGVALLSRWPCTEVVTDIPQLEDPARRSLPTSPRSEPVETDGLFTIWRGRRGEKCAARHARGSCN